jgi:hypothetical protein
MTGGRPRDANALVQRGRRLLAGAAVGCLGLAVMVLVLGKAVRHERAQLTFLERQSEVLAVKSDSLVKAATALSGTVTLGEQLVLKKVLQKAIESGDEKAPPPRVIRPEQRGRGGGIIRESPF